MWFWKTCLGKLRLVLYFTDWLQEKISQQKLFYFNYRFKKKTKHESLVFAKFCYKNTYIILIFPEKQYELHMKGLCYNQQLGFQIQPDYNMYMVFPPLSGPLQKNWKLREAVWRNAASDTFSLNIRVYS